MSSNTLVNSAIELTNDNLLTTKRVVGNSISKFDTAIKMHCQKTMWSWQLISAIAYTESRFTPNSYSSGGAIGLMQIMPVTARHYGLDPKRLGDPHISIIACLLLLDEIESSFRFPTTIDKGDKLKIVLAAYNAGISPILEARQMAAQSGLNCNSWAVVSSYISSGQATGFANKVTSIYHKYLSN